MKWPWTRRREADAAFLARLETIEYRVREQRVSLSCRLCGWRGSARLVDAANGRPTHECTGGVVGEVTWTPGPGVVETATGVWIAPDEETEATAPGEPMGPEWIEIGATDAGWGFGSS